MKRKIRGIILIVLGLEFVLFGAVFLNYYERQASEAAQNAQILLNEINREMHQNRIENIVVESPEKQMPQVLLKGYPVIGILKAENTDIELPVIDNWNYDRLKVSPCRFSGSLEGKDLVLIGHNYEGHLKNLDQLKSGDGVTFVDASGKEHFFEVEKTAILAPEQVDKLISKEHALTVVTCTPTGKSRFAIYCIEKHRE